MKRRDKIKLLRANTLRLIKAANDGDAKLVAELLPVSDPNGADELGMTALAMAVIGDHVECVEILAPACDPNMPDTDGMSPALLAISFNSEECLRLMLPSIDPGPVRGLLPWSPIRAASTRGQDALMIATALGHGDCAKALLTICDPIARDAEGHTALMIAARRRDAKLVRLLAPASDGKAADWAELVAWDAWNGARDGRADPIVDYIHAVGSKAAEREASLRMAAWAGERDIVERHMRACSPTFRDAKGRTALMHAAAEGQTECVKLLLGPGVPCAVDEEGQSALMWAIKRDQRQCALLLADESDTSSADLNGRTALMMAAQRGWPDVVAALLPRSDANAVDLLGRTALMLAAMRRGELSTECVARLLPDSWADAVDLDGMTALMHAAAAGHWMGVAHLLPASNHMAICPFTAASAADLAREGRHRELADQIDCYIAKVERQAIEDEIGATPGPIVRARSL